MNNDLIRRQDAIDELEVKKDKTVKGTIGQFYNTIIQLDIDTLMELPSVQPQQTCEYWDSESKFCALCRPSAQPEPQWIPCSERLPEDYEDVLVWFEYFRYGSYNRLYQTHGIGDYSSEFGSWIINHQTGWHKLRVLAWMPLPEPPKGAER